MNGLFIGIIAGSALSAAYSLWGAPKERRVECLVGTVVGVWILAAYGAVTS